MTTAGRDVERLLAAGWKPCEAAAPAAGPWQPARFSVRRWYRPGLAGTFTRSQALRMLDSAEVTDPPPQARPPSP